MIRRTFVILLGLLLVVILTPLTQFLSIKATNVVAETDSPVGWAVGLLAGLILSVAAVRLLGRWTVLRRSDLVVLYAMLAISVPLMNLGLPRLFFVANQSVLREYLLEGTHTYRTAYNALDDDWFPLIPTREGLAWSQAERSLRMLQSPEAQRVRAEAERRLVLHFSGDEATDLASLRAAVEQLGADEAETVLRTAAAADVRPGDEALLERIKSRRAEAEAETEAALASLRAILPRLREPVLAFLPETLEGLDYSALRRVEAARDAITTEEAVRLEEATASFREIERGAREAVDRLTRGHFAGLTAELAAVQLERLKALSPEAFEAEREDFVYRLSRDERRRILRMSGEGDAPNQNLWAFQFSLWDTTALRQAKERNSLGENLAVLRERLPWGIWWKPLLNWYLFFVALFLFFAFLAEWLRRKWVDRENLPFPVVEIIDNLIRHDQRLEHAADVQSPEPRRRPFNTFFLIGLAVGFALLSVEALNHYAIWSNNLIVYFDLSRNVFSPVGSAMKELQTVIFVLSPVVVGITFLLSLETSFSIWVSYLAYVVLTWWIKLGLGDISDSMYTGFGSGKLYPFHMEQLLGAVLCFALFLVVKAWPRGGGGGGPVSEPYMPPFLTRFGLILLPPLLIALLYSAGVSHIPLLVIFFLVVTALAIASARVRAETGLPQAHVFYESTKLPMVLGMTEWTGAKVFAAFTNIVFLPATLLIRTLGQQLENIELARRNRVSYKTVGVASVLSVVVTIAVGMLSFLFFSYFIGRDFFAESALPPQSGGVTSPRLATYALWVSHFLGEPGLDKFNQLNLLRVGAIAAGFGVVAVLLFLRRRFMRFPIAPVGYVVVLLSFQYNWVSPYLRHDQATWEASLIWGGVFVGWLIKKLVVKYGGMNVYRSAKPFFIGLVAGSVLTVFGWNLLDLVISINSAGTADPLPFFKPFIENAPFNPLVY